jgi:phosphate-selective porin OprO/OprP
MKKYVLAAALCFGIAASAFAQEEKLVVKPSGRILMDGAIMHSSDDVADAAGEAGFNVPDVRIGMKASYGNWEGKVDVGYARQSLSVKDVFIQYNFDKKNFLRGGYFVHQFGYQSATSSSFKIAMEEPETHSAFGVGGRLLGLMFEHSDDKFMGAASLYTDNQSFKKQTNETGYQGSGLMTRLVYHPCIERGNLFQVGVGLNYELASKNGANMKWTSPYPTRVAKLTAMGVELADAKSDFKFGLNPALSCDDDGRVDGVVGWFTGNEKKSRLALTGGYLRKLADPLYLYVGGGYGTRVLAWEMYVDENQYEYVRVEPKSFKGFEAELGLIFRTGIVAFSAGVQTNQFKYYEANVGIGLMF